MQPRRAVSLIAALIQVLSPTSSRAAEQHLALERYTGRDSSTGIPRYVPRAFTADERRMLRQHFGIDDPSLLYRNDEGFIVFDSRRDTGLRDYVNTHRVGGRSIRRWDETYAELEVRVKGKPAEYFGASVTEPDRSIESLDPTVQQAFRELLIEARKRGLKVEVMETYRSPERQAYLLSHGKGITHTATSLHSDRRAMDVKVADGNLRNRRTRAAYQEFQYLALALGFTLVGNWDPGHVQRYDVNAQPGFTRIEDLMAAAVTADVNMRKAMLAARTQNRLRSVGR